MKDFLASIGLENTDIKEKLAKEHITLDLLKTMDHGHLQKIGITSYGVRHKLLKEVKNLDQGQPLLLTPSYCTNKVIIYFQTVKRWKISLQLLV